MGDAAGLIPPSASQASWVVAENSGPMPAPTTATAAFTNGFNAGFISIAASGSGGIALVDYKNPDYQPPSGQYTYTFSLNGGSATKFFVLDQFLASGRPYLAFPVSYGFIADIDGNWAFPDDIYDNSYSLPIFGTLPVLRRGAAPDAATTTVRAAFNQTTGAISLLDYPSAGPLPPSGFYTITNAEKQVATKQVLFGNFVQRSVNGAWRAACIALIVVVSLLLLAGAAAFAYQRRAMVAAPLP